MKEQQQQATAETNPWADYMPAECWRIWDHDNGRWAAGAFFSKAEADAMHGRYQLSGVEWTVVRVFPSDDARKLTTALVMCMTAIHACVRSPMGVVPGLASLALDVARELIPDTNTLPGETPE